MIRTEQLVKTYENGAIKALQGVDVAIAKGEFACIMGPSGSGKSTFLNMIGALDRPTSGRVWLNGHDLTNVPDLDRIRAREVGFVFQLHNLIPTLTAAENVEIPMFAVGRARAERQKRAAELLELVGLTHRANSIAVKLSGGERQRVSIARALANRPGVILADEPTGDLDSATGREIMKTLEQMRRESGATLIVVTHDLEVGERAGRWFRMRDGRMTEDAR
ncbi:MAG: ABC transporter ATP-binding protein [Planctomycetes bacterium]|nr:ABC transporter ATP-binding protein [Planctomycetota bacterium]